MSKHNRTIIEAKIQKLSALKYGDSIAELMDRTDQHFRELNFNIICIDDSTDQQVKESLSACFCDIIALAGHYNTNISELTEIATKTKEKENETTV